MNLRQIWARRLRAFVKNSHRSRNFLKITMRSLPGSWQNSVPRLMMKKLPRRSDEKVVKEDDVYSIDLRF